MSNFPPIILHVPPFSFEETNQTSPSWATNANAAIDPSPTRRGIPSPPLFGSQPPRGLVFLQASGLRAFGGKRAFVRLGRGAFVSCRLVVVEVECWVDCWWMFSGWVELMGWLTVFFLFPMVERFFNFRILAKIEFFSSAGWNQPTRCSNAYVSQIV